MLDFRYKHSNSDERAMFTIACIIFLCIAVFIAVEHYRTPDEPKEEPVHFYGKTSLTEAEIADNLHAFDPNTVDSATLLSFGLKPYQIKVFMNYRRKGAKFRKPESIGKIYTWDDETIERLMPFVTIGEEYKTPSGQYAERSYQERNSKSDYDRSSYSRQYDRQEGDLHRSDSVRHYKRSDKFTSATQVDINTADSALLTRIPGIGGTTARSIIRLREKLGGYYSTVQLKQIGYLNDNPELLAWFKVSDTHLQKIDINHATFNTLRTHPYITYEQTKDILDYRRNYGNITNAEVLISTGIFADEELQRLLPYIDFTTSR